MVPSGARHEQIWGISCEILGSPPPPQSAHENGTGRILLYGTGPFLYPISILLILRPAPVFELIQL